ncbi:LuxR C-terminal-related transcriptional regulator [Cnuella takakiae]|nr:response regulator transcription factor [Cnuella takakiae]OLY92366.1 hypothetical protein BUE76_11040 [Cnuella takakiae]
MTPLVPNIKMQARNQNNFPHHPEMVLGIIEDDPQFADNLALILSQNEGVRIAFTSPSIELAIYNHHKEMAQCHALLLDINLDGMNGISGIPLIKRYLPQHCQVLMLTLHEGSEAIRDAFREGAAGYLLKADSLNVLQDYILSSLRVGAPAISRPVFNQLLEGLLYNQPADKPAQSRLPQLTDREQDLYQLLLKGWDNKRMAAHLQISGATVNFHLKNIFIKMEVRSRAELLARHLELVAKQVKP